MFSECNCDPQGSMSTSCNASGICPCISNNIEGDKCSDCKENYYNFPSCSGKYKNCLKY